MKHDIPSWYIPDGEQVLANEHEREEIEETGELEEPLCPHCGGGYLGKSGNMFIHALTTVGSDVPGEGAQQRIGSACVNGENRTMNGYLDDDSPPWRKGGAL